MIESSQVIAQMIQMAKDMQCGFATVPSDQ